MKRSNRASLYSFIAGAAVAIAAVFLFNFARDGFFCSPIQKTVSSTLKQYKIPNKDIVGKIKRQYIEKRYWVSDSFPINEFESDLRHSLEKRGFKLLSVSNLDREVIIKGKKETRRETSFLISEYSSSVPIFCLTLIKKILYQPKPVGKGPVIAPPIVPALKPSIPAKPPQEVLKPAPRIAIVLDDWGYNTRNLEDLLKIDKPITLSILPNLPYSTLIADKAKENGFEVILHMPMEPKRKMRLELNTIYTTMSNEEIRSCLARAFASVANADGLSNHEGSKASEDERVMTLVLGELKKSNMIFLDSFVTSKSVGESVAKRMGVRFIRRDIFLDNESDLKYIKGQLEKTIRIALKYGEAVAIGHDRPNTIAVVREMLPEIEAKGIELKPISDLAR